MANHRLEQLEQALDMFRSAPIDERMRVSELAYLDFVRGLHERMVAINQAHGIIRNDSSSMSSDGLDEHGSLVDDEMETSSSAAHSSMPSLVRSDMKESDIDVDSAIASTLFDEDADDDDHGGDTDSCRSTCVEVELPLLDTVVESPDAYDFQCPCTLVDNTTVESVPDALLCTCYADAQPLYNDWHALLDIPASRTYPSDGNNEQLQRGMEASRELRLALDNQWF